MRGAEENATRRDDGERGEDPQAQPVDDERRELPVVTLLLKLIFFAQPVGEVADLAQDVLEQRRTAAEDVCVVITWRRSVVVGLRRCRSGS